MIRNKKIIRFIALFMVTNLVYELCFPLAAYALTGGPSQPEVQSFEPVGTTEMVDLATGDFNYNIPLLDVEGYPINIAYHADISMDQEASWVGLGWNINPGVINRNMRGLPDDFHGFGTNGTDGDRVEKEFYMEPTQTYGVMGTLGWQLLGKDLPAKDVLNAQLSLSLGVSYNSYKGVGYELGISPAITASVIAQNDLTIGLGLSANSQDGFGVEPSVTYSIVQSKTERAHGTVTDATSKIGFTVGTQFNSRSGLGKLSYGITYQSSYEKTTYGDIQWQKSSCGGSSWGNVSSTTESGQQGDALQLAGSSIQFGTKTYTPNITLPTSTYNNSFYATAGAEVTTNHPDVTLSGYEGEQSLMWYGSNKGAYGYLYTHLKPDDDVLLDFNREREAVLSENTSNLPLANYSYDQFAVSGQGIGAQYRLYRSDINIMHNDRGMNMSSSGSIGGKAGGGNGAHFGAKMSTNTTEGNSNAWMVNNKLWDVWGYSADYRYAASNAEPLYEPAYFKSVGETTPIDKDFFDIFGYDKPVRPFIHEQMAVNEPDQMLGITAVAEAKLIVGYDDEATGTPINVSSNHRQTTRARRDKRNQYIQYLTAYDAQWAAHDRELHSFSPADAYGVQQKTSFNRVDYTPTDLLPKKRHHISEIVATNPDGMRYVYGIPAYNLFQEEYTFSVATNNNTTSKDPDINVLDQEGTLVTYWAGHHDKALINNKGFDHYVSKTKTPGYAHSYLLTQVLSPDYVDVTGNGITFEDDLGTAVKINYQRKYGNFSWRAPVGLVTETINSAPYYDNTVAFYSEGFRNDHRDNKASYMHGQKEIWYVTSIESKNYVAEFTLSSRIDAAAVPQHGGLSSVHLMKLDKITLYAKADRKKNKAQAVPVKTVHFEYDYSLCPNVPNNSNAFQNAQQGQSMPNTGKLTLRKIYFTYGKSNKAALSPYEFFYDGLNPAYSHKQYDRWGNYKPAEPNIPSADFPFVNQEQKIVNNVDVGAKTSEYSSAWSLTRIKLPSGGTIKVEYESDDYAFVQNKRAMQMFKLIGVANTLNITNPSTQILSELYSGADTYNNYLFFELNKWSDNSTPAKIGQNYFMDENKRLIELMQFNLLVDLKDDGQHKEYVRGYAEVDYSDLGSAFGKISNEIGFVKVKEVGIGDKENGHKKVSPLVKTAWQFARLQKPEWVHPGSNPNATGESAIRGLLGSMSEITTLWKSFNRTLENKGYARHFDPGKSWIRLYNPRNKKYGGGHRIKRIELKDNWDAMNGLSSGVLDATYGQEYTYTTQNNGEEISSGVAAYEPALGSEENPWTYPVNWQDIENLMAPDDKYYTEGPYGESFFPAPTVIYSKVEVKNIKPAGAAITKNATGKVVHEFYTARDFPTLAYNTPIKKERHKAHRILPTEIEDYLTASQGYVVEVNDMHGKPKAQWVYAEGKKDYQSGVEYLYQTHNPDKTGRLYNKVKVLNKATNEVTEEFIATEIDFCLDSRESKMTSISGGVQFTTDVVIAGLIPAPFPMVWPSHSSQKTRFRSLVATKVVQRFGVLKKTIAHNNGAQIETENILYDKETGNVLLTRTQNEFRDDIYNFVYPAHFAYDGMGAAYQNVGAQFNSVSLHNTTGAISLTGLTNNNPEAYFYPGDEVAFTQGSTVTRGWIHRSAINNQLIVINRAGNKLTGMGSLRIVRSGRRNLQHLSIANITTKKSPINTTTNQVEFTALSGILHASATQYSNEWGKYCNPVFDRTDCWEETDSYSNTIEEMLALLVSSGNINTPGRYDAVGTDFNTSIFKHHLDSLCPRPGTYKWEVIHETETMQNGHIRYIWKVRLLKEYPDNTTCYLPAEPEPCGGFLFRFDLEMESGPRPVFDVFEVLAPRFADIYPPPVNPGTQDDPGYNDFRFNFRLHYLDASNQDQWYTGHWSQSEDQSLRPEMALCKAYRCSTICIQNFNSGKLNPYVTGLRGNWRTKRELLYNGQRNYSTNPDVRNDGTYTTFSPFWTLSNSTWVPRDITLLGNAEPWTWTNTINQYNPQGAEIENKDALDRYSAALYAKNNLPVAVAGNARLRQIAFDGFEDDPYQLPGCETEHWDFKANQQFFAHQDATYAHTGKYSYKVEAYREHSVLRYTTAPPMVAYNCSQTDHEYTLQPYCDCIERFAPDVAQKYVFSAWVKDDVSRLVETYTAPTIDIVLSDYDPNTNDIVYTVTASGPVIEGWQRMEKVFDIPSGITTIKVVMKAGTEHSAWFDDLRCHPYDGNMKSYVYDPITMKLLATLDENNFATFYEYDQQGALIRVKQETVKGIVTISSSRSSSNKINP